MPSSAQERTKRNEADERMRAPERGGWLDCHLAAVQRSCHKWKTREQAIKAAREVLEIEAGDLIRDGKPAPRMQHLSEVAVLEVEVSTEDAERMEYVTKTKAAEWLDVSKPRITALISEGVLETKRFGRDELVSIASIDAFEKIARKPGRPKAAKAIA